MTIRVNSILKKMYSGFTLQSRPSLLTEVSEEMRSASLLSTQIKVSLVNSNLVYYEPDKNIKTTIYDAPAKAMNNAGIEIITGIKFVKIPGGSFEMGYVDRTRDKISGYYWPYSRRTVNLSPFWLGVTEVTLGQWNKIMGSTPVDHKTGNQILKLHGGQQDIPVNQVVIDQINKFIKEINNQRGLNFSLPSEAQWEYACRAGGKNILFGTQNGKISHDLANYHGMKRNNNWKHWSPVSSFPPNALGLYDMTGNVQEWVEDLFAPNYLNVGVNDPVFRKFGRNRIFRGGNFSTFSANSQCLYRGFTNPKNSSVGRGFRLSMQNYVRKPISSNSTFPGTLSASGNILATASGHSVLLWDVRSGNLITTLDGAKGWITKVHFSEDHNLIVAESTDGRKTYWWNESKLAQDISDKMADESFVKAKHIDTVEAYKEFLKTFPTSLHVSKVKSILNKRVVWLTGASQANKNITLTKGFTSPFNEIQKQTQLSIDEYVVSLVPPSIVLKPQPPSAPPKLVKDQFETREMFQTRVQTAQLARQKQIYHLQEQYRKDVEARNTEWERRQQLKSPEGLHKMTKEFMNSAIYDVMGATKISDLVYDAETQRMIMNIKAANGLYSKKIAVPIPLDIAKSIYENKHKIKPIMVFHIKKNNAIRLQKIFLEYENQNFTAKLTKEDFQPQQMVVAVKDIKVKFSAADQQLQNPNLTDTFMVQTISYGDSAQAEGLVFEDDLVPLLEKLPPKKVDPKKWLFVVAVENYAETDRVIFAKRSAEMFKKTVQKSFGVKNRNTYALIDEKATSGAIQDKLERMLANVKEGDTIYFYYSGHGIPDPKSGESYILPQDKIVDYISRDKAFQLSHLYKQLSDSKSKQVVAFIDSCFSGKTDNQLLFKGVAPGLIRTKKVQFNAKKMLVISAGKNNQFSNSYDERGHRMFTYFLMKSLIAGRRNLDTLYKEVSLNVADASNEKGDVYLQEPQIEGNLKLEL